MSSLESNVAAMAFLCLAGGPISLMVGLRKLNEKRLLENTPVSKVRSAAMGLVELSGMARQHKPQKSPCSNMDVCWWDCRVEELRSDGKNSYWAIIKQVSSMDLFYLEDSTGQVLVNPIGAELHVLIHTFDLNASTRTLIAPVLNSWGLNDMNWFGLENRLRIIEQLIPDCAPLFIMGELISVGNQPEDRRAKFMARLRAIKTDPAKMAEADVNHDGTVDADEWAAFEAKQEEEFMKEEIIHQAQMPNEEKIMLKAPINAPFVVSTQEEQSLVTSFNWLAPFGIFAGIALSAVGVWIGIELGWKPFFIIGLVGLALGVGVFTKSLNITFGRS